MREWAWRFFLVCGVVSLCGAGAGAEPTYSIWVTGVYERVFDNGEWVWISKCPTEGVDLNPICPTPHLPRLCALSGDECDTTDDCPAGQGCTSIAAAGDFISFEVYLEGWDIEPDIGVCNDFDQTEGCSVGDDSTCPNFHCTFTGTPCDDTGDCNPPNTCDPDICLPDPLAANFQWTIDSSTFWTYPDPGERPGLEPANIPCSVFPKHCEPGGGPCETISDCPGGQCLPHDLDTDCWCNHDDFCFDQADQCTCALSCEADETCPARSSIYLERGRSDYLFKNRLAIIAFNTVSWGYQAGARLIGQVIPQGCRGLEGIAEYCPPSEPPYHVGSFMLHVIDRPPGEKTECGTYEIDFDGSTRKTFLKDSLENLLEPLTVIPATVDLADFCVERGANCFAEHGPPPFCERWWCDPCTGLCKLLPDVGHTCDDGDPCTVFDMCTENSECAGQAKVCGLGEFCNADNNGECEPGACPLPESIVGATPAHCAIDARQPHTPGNDANPMGWDEWVITFAEGCAPRSLGLRRTDFVLTLNPFGGVVPLIDRVFVNDATREIRVRLEDPIQPGRWTCLQLIDPKDPLNVSGPWCLGYLPGDTGQDKRSTANDIQDLLDSINGVDVKPLYATDANRSGLPDAKDILRLIDLLNGAMLFDPGWMGEELPRCGLPVR